MSQGQHVFYSYDPTVDPQWTYTSFPVGCFGLAKDLEEARANYHEAYSIGTEDILDVPDSVEHIEQRHPSGVWIRVRIGTDVAERDRVAMVLYGTLLQHLPAAKFLSEQTETSTGQPTVIACLPTDTIRSIADEIDEKESLVVALAFPDREHSRDLVWISGLTRGTLGQPVRSLDEAGLTLDSTMEELMRSTGITPKSLSQGDGISSTPLLVNA